ncbi:serine protease inhibitor [Synechococcus sp. RedBA-s]|uniref:serine protease inhibitor n=1 Tax=Synechococcus sp. RedBA-s TaxID=2823741 RepID=UPI0020CE21AA|nr:serine protease inhibitor [Synechococcus sp. RedBA-s]MCP9799244.1 serine protease inhibitor [Synechococcus sp. RedBA-s]
MAASSFSPPRLLSAGQVRPDRARPWSWSLPRSLGALPWLVVALVLTAALVAPEQPEQLAALCQRHSGPAACRVW